MLAKRAGWFIKCYDKCGEHSYEDGLIRHPLLRPRNPRNTVINSADLLFGVGIDKVVAEIVWHKKIGKKGCSGDPNDEGKMMKRFCPIIYIFDPGICGINVLHLSE